MFIWKCRLSLKSNVIGIGSLLAKDNLHMLDTMTFYNESLNTKSCGTKCKVDETYSGVLWHKCLGHTFMNIVQ